MPSKRSRRKGTAVVEAALTLPLVLLLISATVELSTAIYLKESLTIAEPLLAWTMLEKLLRQPNISRPS